MEEEWWHHGQGVVAPWTRGGGTYRQGMMAGWTRGGGTYRQEGVVLWARGGGRMDRGWWHLQTGGGGTAGRECWYHREVVALIDKRWWHHGQGVVAPMTGSGGSVDKEWWHRGCTVAWLCFLRRGSLAFPHWSMGGRSCRRCPSHEALWMQR